MVDAGHPPKELPWLVTFPIIPILQVLAKRLSDCWGHTAYKCQGQDINQGESDSLESYSEAAGRPVFQEDSEIQSLWPLNCTPHPSLGQPSGECALRPFLRVHKSTQSSGFEV